MSTDIWITADTHLGHNSIIEHCSRPFRDAAEMDEVLSNNWNARVRPGDLVYHLGDFCYAKDGRRAPDYLRSLNGRIVLIQGNHDRQTDLEAFDEHAPYLEIKVTGVRLCLCHYAMRVWRGSHRGSLHAYAHSHGRLAPLGRSMDVGVDTNNYWPYHLDEVVQKLLALDSAPDR